jgi:hypothetical protein
MSGKFFLLPSEGSDLPARVVISVDQNRLCDLLGLMRALRDGLIHSVHLRSEKGFEGINLDDILFKCGTVSQMYLNDRRVLIEAKTEQFSKFFDLIQALQTKQSGHQYLDCSIQNVDFDLLISTGEYTEDFTKRLRH